MNPLTLFNNLMIAFKLWQQYGGGVEKAVTIIQQINALHNGHTVDAIEKVLMDNGINVSAMLAAIGGAIDLTTVKGIQQALLDLNTSLTLPVTGILDAPTLAAVSAFQTSQGLTVDSIPGPQTIASLQTALVAKNIPTI